MRMPPHLLPALLALALALSGCSGGPGRPDAEARADDDAPGSAPSAAPEEAPPVETVLVSDDVAMSGTLGANACFFDGDSVECANVGGSNVLRHEHARKGTLLGGTLTVTFTPGSNGNGPRTSVSIVEDCPGSCRVVQEIAEGHPVGLAPTGATADYDVEVPAASIPANQTLVVRVAPILVTSLASASPPFEVDVTGALSFEVPADEA